MSGDQRSKETAESALVLGGGGARAINACALAGHAKAPLRGVAALAPKGTGLRAKNMLRVDRCELLGMVRGLGRRSQRGGALQATRHAPGSGATSFAAHRGFAL